MILTEKKVGSTSDEVESNDVPAKRILVIKTSSMGDVIHTFYALTDALKVYPNLEVDWVVEESFAQLPILHPAVKRVFPIAIRRWRKSLFKTLLKGEIKHIKQQIKTQKYECIIDAQGLLKSAWLTRWNKAGVYGYDKASIKEPVASFFYDHTITVSKSLHAVERIRTLFANTLNYALPKETGTCTLSIPKAVMEIVQKSCPTIPENSIMLIHGTTWASKHVPEVWWEGLIARLNEAGKTVVLPWSNHIEKERASRLALKARHSIVLPKLNLMQFSAVLIRMQSVVAVDTGPAHLAAALGVKTVGLYGATQSGLTGLYGVHVTSVQASLQCSPCMKKECRFKDSVTEFEMMPPCYATLDIGDVMKQINGL